MQVGHETTYASSENQNFEIFAEIVHNFGKCDDDIILWKNAYFQYT